MGSIDEGSVCVGELVSEPGHGGSMLEVHVAHGERENRLEEPGPGAKYCRENRLGSIEEGSVCVGELGLNARGSSV